MQCGVALKKRTVYLLVVCGLFLAAGTAATMSTKWADLLEAPDNLGNVSSFEHPFFQTLVMFLGETMCFAAFHAMLWKKRSDGEELKLGEDYPAPINQLWFAIPAAADFTASTLNNVALNLTSASVYQMLKGSTVLFTAVLSFIFLKRRFFRYEYLGMVIVITGLTIVGVSASLRKASKEASNPVLGNILVIVGQLVQSSQFVFEESLMKKYRIPPTYMVGWEGLFGVTLTVVTLAIFQAFNGRPDDAVIAFEQIGNCWRCGIATLVVLMVIPIFNGSANTITKELSAATRMILDALRNISVWGFTMLYASYFNESFDWLQLVGFIFLLVGSGIYREIIRIPHPFFRVSPEVRAMLQEGVLDESAVGYASLGADDPVTRGTEMVERCESEGLRACSSPDVTSPTDPLCQRESLAANL